MDEKIFKAILLNSESTKKTLDEADYKQLLQEEEFSFKSNSVLNALCDSLTKLLCHTVSKEAYQRYSVRTHIIEVIRDWCRISREFRNFQGFTNGENTLELVKKILEKCLTDEILDDCDINIEFIRLTSAVMCLAARHTCYIPYAEKLLIRLSNCELCDDGERLLYYAMDRKSNLKLGLQAMEDLYISQKCKLIEQPLLNKFKNHCIRSDKAGNNDCNEESVLDQLLEVAVFSPNIFLVICLFLKNLLAQLDYAPSVLNFIQLILNDITTRCKSHEKAILDLYPKSLEYAVIPLRLEISLHTKNSYESTLSTLKSILNENKDFAMILLSHFPMWLKPFNDYLAKNATNC